ncbi:MAG TPA: HAD-IG family 5'-nucleotidase [Polyangia bacterium]|jgi:HAD superfamily 5'-nucleotidase-like hydrolase|nr:HAD-IG family 5'-nucleotidase [Polyangia bacterium]
MSSAREAQAVLQGPRSLDLPEPPARLDIPRGNRVYVNRNLRLDRIEMVGFDMDYTLALYNQARIEELSMRATLHKLVTAKSYPSEIQNLLYDPTLAIRGLVVDRVNGNIFKPDRYGYPGRAQHGLATIDRAKVAELYQRERMRLSNRRYAWIDSLFALPEAVLYAALVEYFDHSDLPGKPDYNTLWEHIRECIDLAHRDGSIKTIVSANLADYVTRDPALAETLHKFRSSGKRLFLLTNSAWDYTSQLMSYLLDGTLGAYPSWRNYFDVIVVSAGKPEFFTEDRPFIDLDQEGLPLTRASEGAFLRGRIYSGGNLKQFQERARASGDKVLFVGDHIYGDMLRSRKSSNWRTAMVLQELEHEVTTYDQLRASLSRLDQLDSQLIQLDAELNDRQTAMRALQKLEDSDAGKASIKDAKRTVKEAIERLRHELRTATAQHRTVEAEIDYAFNPHWGPLFREGYEVSKFGEQVEAYACVYTSRVSNFRFYSPMQYFRGPRDRMPHER